jgi:hypothetical protein
MPGLVRHGFDDGHNGVVGERGGIQAAVESIGPGARKADARGEGLPGAIGVTGAVAGSKEGLRVPAYPVQPLLDQRMGIPFVSGIPIGGG